MTELERKSLMGDKEAQRVCTEKGVVLRCPCCKCEAETLTEQGNFTGEGIRTFYYVRCKSCFTRSASYTSKIAAESKWNTRPASRNVQRMSALCCRMGRRWREYPC